MKRKLIYTLLFLFASAFASIQSEAQCTVSGLSMNYCGRSSFILAYTSSSSFNGNNVFYAELSDSTGNFSSPDTVGRVFTSANGNIRIVLPAVTKTGTQYMLRVSGSSPSTTGIAAGPFTITANPQAYVGNSTSICIGGSASLGTTANPGSTYSWTSNNGFTANTSSVTVTPGSTAIYYLNETINGCTSINSATVTVNPLPAAAVCNPASIIDGTPIAIGATAVTGSTYVWTSNPVGFNSTLANPVVTPDANTNYTLTETSIYGCLASNSTLINVTGLNASISRAGGSSICPGTSQTFTAVTNGPSGVTYQWYSSLDGNSYTSIPGATSVNYIASPSSTTFYNFVVTNGAVGSTSAAIVLSLYKAATANAGSNTSINAGTSTKIGAKSVAGSTYSWTSSPVGFTSTLANPTVTPLSTTVYSLTETTSHSCSATNTVTISTIAPLPVTLISFDVKLLETIVKLDWKTASEINNRHFIIERSTEGQIWTAIGTITGHGNAIVENDYSFSDNLDGLVKGGTLYYRLKQVDFNSQYTYTSIKAVTFNATIAGISIFPNPVKDFFTVNMSDNKIKSGYLELLNANGKVLFSEPLQGENLWPRQYSLAKYPAGIYYLEIRNQDCLLIKQVVKN